MVKHYTPVDLAEFVYNKLSTSKTIKNKPSMKTLTVLFNTLYYASLQTEEGQFIKVTITLIDHTTILKSGSKSDSKDKWKFFDFDEALEFNIKNLVKLSKAADPWSSSLAVFNSEDDLYIYGMIDQSIHYQSFLNYEKDDKPGHPGILQTMINGIGILNVMLDYQALATLNQNVLIKLYPNVFGYGPVSRFIHDNVNIDKKAIELNLGKTIDEDEFSIYQDDLLVFIIQSISRILLKIKNYHHGGAILITKNWSESLKSKYSINYTRTPSSIYNVLNALLEQDRLNEKVKILRKEKEEISLELFDKIKNNQLDLKESRNEMIGAIRFVASLSCVDGLILLSPMLDVHGFGTVITEKNDPEYVYINRNARFSTNLTKIKSNHFGTRHRSMFAYCNQNPESVGFVISQDGDVRAIMKVGDKVVIWENIKVYQFQKSKKLLAV